MLGQECTTEQYVPKWDRVKRGRSGHEEVERARLDVVFNGTAGPVYIDIAVTEAAAAGGHTSTDRARNDGAAALHEEKEKHRRYPGPDLVPFVLEANGRLGEEAELLLRSVAPLDPSERAAEISAAKRSLSTLLQLGNAEIVLSAQGGMH